MWSKISITINVRESACIKHFQVFKAFIEYSNDVSDIYKNIEQCNANKKRKVLNEFNYTIPDLLSNKNLIQ